jgi:23S rRNA pseudouridine1911/1915/1917 synthase
VTRPPRIVTADRGDAGRRIDLVLRRHLADLDAATRTRVQAWIAEGCVTVNGTPVRRPSVRAAAGDVVAIDVPPAFARRPRPEMPPEEVPLPVLYEDDHLIAVDKPAGIVVHPTYGHDRGTVMNALLWRARDWPPGQRPSIVGRLDKLTSGLVIAAKSPAVHAALQRAMTSPRAVKEYLALVYGRPAARGTIDLRLRRDPRDRRRVVASSGEGAPSRTRFERVARADAPRAGLCLLRCRLVTGRTHQIRVHLAGRGWPLVGDPVYGEPRWQDVDDPLLREALRAFPRQALHASRLAVVHPATGVPLAIAAPLPRDLGDLVRAAGLVECPP